MTIEEICDEAIKPLPPSERFRLVTLILNEIPPQSVVDISDAWNEEDVRDVGAYPRGRSRRMIRRNTALSKPGDVVVIDFPGVTGIKRRPAIVLMRCPFRSSRTSTTGPSGSTTPRVKRTRR